MNLFAQVADFAPLVPQLGFGGVILWIVVKRLDSIEHTLRGLSRALWMDLAARPYADKFIKEQARSIIAEMDADKRRR